MSFNKSALAFAVSFSMCLYALHGQENNPLINSGEVLDEGMKLYDQGKYKEAIEKYSLISRSDTNYIPMLGEIALAYVADSQFTKAMEVCNEGLKGKSSIEVHFYNIKGTALDGAGKKEESIKTYKEAIAKYPYDYQLLFNLAVTLEGKDKKEAEFFYKKALMQNPFHGSSNYQLAKIAYERGQLVPALMSYYMYLLAYPSGQYAGVAITNIDKISKNQDDYTPKKTSIDNFYELELLIDSKIALSAKYKTKVKIKDPIINQTQLFLEKIQYNPSDTGFWMQHYAPFYAEIYKKGYTEDFIYSILAGVNQKEIQAWLSSNKSKHNEFVNWASNFINDRRSELKISVEGVEKKVAHWYYSDNKIKAIGDYKDLKATSLIKQGEWIYFYDNGIVEARGYYDVEGNKRGEWKSYTDEGVLHEVAKYNSGKLNGMYTYYHPNGVLNYECKVIENNIEGACNIYDEAGRLTMVKNYKTGKLDGNYIGYYNNGELKSEGTYKDGLQVGKWKFYYYDGQLKEIGNYTEEGEIGGVWEIYYDNGELKSEGNYKDGLQVGEWKFYYDNGQLKEVGAYTEKGEANGIWKTYYESGGLKAESTNSSKAKKHGVYKEYDEDGKLYFMQEYDNGKMRSYKYYDKQGNIVSEEKGNSFTFKSFYPDGKTPAVEGVYKNGDSEGAWKYYNKNGVIISIHNYLHDRKNGITKHFYSNGNIKSEEIYKDDVLDGYYKNYYSNGQLSSEGWYKDGMKQGDWITYYSNGSIEEKIYYLNDVLDGYNLDYNVKGVKESEEYTRYGMSEEVSNYDTLGNIISVSTFNHGTGLYGEKYPNGNVKVSGKEEKALFEGEWTFYHGNKQINRKYQYVKGYREGKGKEYYDNGNLSCITNYVNGNESGNFIWYQEDGKTLATNGYYERGMKDSVWSYYYDNGYISEKGNYEKDELNGEYIYYAPDMEGEIALIRKFKNGNIISYTYLDKLGNRVPDIMIEHETVDIVSYYKNGNKAVEYKIVNGNREGAMIKYYINGSKYSEVNYKAGNRSGITKYFYDNGKVKSIENYFYDEKDGACKYYYANGNIKSERSYIIGSEHGDFKYYNENGKLINVLKYREGLLY